MTAISMSRCCGSATISDNMPHAPRRVRLASYRAGEGKSDVAGSVPGEPIAAACHS